MPRAIWKGAISFGLVHIPVAVYPASSESGVDFDWVDKRTMDPVGYKRINKRTGREIDKDNIVRGVKQSNGEYVILSDEEIKAAYPKATQTIEIESFVKAAEIPFYYLERPYFLSPVGKGDKVYALLRETMESLGVLGVARVVMHSKERLYILVPDGAALMLNTIRWASDLRSAEDITLPPEGKSAAGLKDAELKMARQLVSDMTRTFDPDEYADRFTEAIHELAAARVKAGKTEQVTALEEAPPAPSRSNVIDLTELLRKSLTDRKGGGGSDAGRAGNGTRSGARKAPTRASSKAARRTKSAARGGTSRRAA